MNPSTELKYGLEILEPFLMRQNFVFDNYENGKSPTGLFTVATYKNKQKKFSIKYRTSIRQVIYQFDKSKVCHDFYLDKLGLADKKQLLNFHPANELLSFKHILDDFEFLVEDFFDGKCVKLQEFSKLEENVIFTHNAKLREEYNFKYDTIRIDSARQLFNNKDFKKSMEIYNTVERKSRFNDLDNNIIAYCVRYVLRTKGN